MTCAEVIVRAHHALQEGFCMEKGLLLVGILWHLPHFYWARACRRHAES